MPSKIQSPVHYSEVEPIHQFEACSFNSILFDQEPAGLPKSERIRKTKVSEPSASVAAPNFFSLRAGFGSDSKGLTFYLLLTKCLN